MKLKEQPGVPLPPAAGHSYHGYTTKGRPIPKRGSLHIQQRPAVPPASDHRTGHHPGLHGESQPYTTAGQPAHNAHAYDVGMNIPTRSRYEALSLEELLEDDEEEYAARLPTSSIRYDLPPGTYTQGNTQLHVKYGAPPPRERAPTTARQGNTGRDGQRVREGRREKGGLHWLVLFGVGMVVMLVLWVLGSLALAWVQTKWEDLTYGYPRTFQCDAVVGHGGDSPARPSHFIALNLHRQVQVVEEPAGGPAQARVYVVLTLVGDGQELTPVTLSFKDVTGDGKPDMLIHIQGQTLVYVNEHGTFRPQRPGEQASL